MKREGGVQVKVLGPVRVDDDGVDVALSPQLRRLLGLLVVADGAPVSADRLAEYVADGRLEGSTVRTAVSRLRKVLGDRVESVDGGYRLVLGTDELDVARFEQLIGRSKQAPTEALCSSLVAALELWLGRPLGDLADEEWATAWCSRLDGLRVGAVEDLADGLIGSGRNREAIESLESLVVEQPYRERPIASLMRALREDGRVADALRVFERFRVTLRDDTGLEPSRALRDLESELLSVEGARDGPGVSGPPLPSGTVTFLFTDIEGSTQRWANDEAGMAAALAAHDGVLREVVGEHEGAVFKHTGDGVCAVFASAPSAVAAAVEAQRRLELPVRMGVHTGEAELRDGDYFGPTLNRVARIMDAGHGGQILMSQATVALAAHVERSDLGEHRLKGLSSPERIFQVGAREFPALRVAASHKGNLPVDATEFVGRVDELADLVERVTQYRCVTLLGVGGTGKTRLATEVGHRLAPVFPDGCWMADLSRVAVSELVPHAVCAGVGLEIPERADVAEYVVSRLRHQRLLLVLDNCEHVLEAAADVVEATLASCLAVTVVATSREPLMVAGEHLVPTPSLTPADAVELFVDRVGAEAPSMVLDERQMVSVRAICDRLDRLPLAIELAASRARSMSPIEIESRLDERFRLLVGGRRSRMERHQTMRGTVDWSYELCDDLERRVFCRLSVFAGAFDLGDALGVAAVDGADRWDVEDALGRLVDRSLVQRLPAPDGTTRYRLLETMRAYGHERLVENGTADAARLRHVEHLAEVIDALGLHVLGPDEEEIRSRVRVYNADLLRAIDWCLEREEWRFLPRFLSLSVGWSIGGAIFPFWARVASRIPPIGEPMDGVAPLLQLGLIAHGGFAENLSASPAWYLQTFMDLVAAGETIPHDVIHLAPLVNVHTAVHAPEGIAAAIVDYIEGLDAAPASVRWSQMFVLHYCLCALDIDEAGRLYGLFEDVTGQLGSPSADRDFHAQGALMFEVRGDVVTADSHARLALAARCATWSDVLIACRVVRISARVHGRLRGADLRRPLEWELEVSNGRFREAPLASIAVALDAAGHAELARRVISALAPEVRIGYADVFQSTAPAALLDAFRSVSPGEHADEVVAAVLALADELDRLEESA